MGIVNSEDVSGFAPKERRVKKKKNKYTPHVFQLIDENGIIMDQFLF